MHDYFNTWRANRELAGGGILIDQGIHMLDLFLYLGEGFDEVHAFVSSLYWKLPGIEDNVFAILRNSKTGQAASLHSTMTQWRHLFSFEVFMERGYMVLNGLKTPSGTYGAEKLSVAKNRSRGAGGDVGRRRIVRIRIRRFLGSGGGAVLRYRAARPPGQGWRFAKCARGDGADRPHLRERRAQRADALQQALGRVMGMTMKNEFFPNYFAEYEKLAFNESVYPVLESFADLACTVRDHGRKMMFGGNGASASLSEHGAVDFTKQGRVRAVTFHDPNLMTCFANDFGYDNWLAKAIEHYADEGDAVVLISVSGTSPSVVNAAKYARERGLPVVSFTGRNRDNPLMKLSDVKFYVDSHAYNVVECIHGIWVTATIDFVIGKSVYETRMVDV